MEIMELLTSRKNAQIRRLRRLGTDRAFRREQGEYLCDGVKLLGEALSAGAEITDVLWEQGRERNVVPGAAAFCVPAELLRYVSPLENSPGPLFSVRMRPRVPAEKPERVLVLENMQDPGNVGTVLRTAAALGVETVLLTGECADPYNPKAVRASMGAVFRQPFRETETGELAALLEKWGLPLYGAALRPDARDIRALSLRRCAVAVGNEGRGLTEEMLSLCRETLIIPMAPESESLNAATAAAVIMWEMTR